MLIFFFGREQEMLDMKRSIKRKGIHPIVVGNRGVGKTSLVKLALHESDAQIIQITCDSKMSFKDFCSALLSKIGVDVDETESTHEASVSGSGKGNIGIASFDAGGVKKSTYKRKGNAQKHITPWTLFEAIKELNRKIVIVIDEYETINQARGDFHDGIASLIKILADNSSECDSRLIVVGIGFSAEALLGKHPSIERSAREIYLHTLRISDVIDFLEHAEEKLKFKFQASVKDLIAKNSFGYPYYVHLVALECIDMMQKRDKNSRVVTEDDYRKAIDRAVQQAFRAVLKKYKQAIAEATEDVKQFIKELAVAQGDGPVTLHAFKAKMQRNGIIVGEHFESAVYYLLHQKKIIYVSRGRQDLRFSDPLMAPFLRSLVQR